MTTKGANKSKRPLRVGNRVKFPYGAGEVEAVIVEDRGNLGIGGRQIVRLRILGRDEPEESCVPPANIEEGSFELPAENVTLIK